MTKPLSSYERALELAKEEASNPQVNCAGCWQLADALLQAEALLKEAKKIMSDDHVDLPAMDRWLKKRKEMMK